MAVRTQTFVPLGFLSHSRFRLSPTSFRASVVQSLVVLSRVVQGLGLAETPRRSARPRDPTVRGSARQTLVRNDRMDRNRDAADDGAKRERVEGAADVESKRKRLSFNQTTLLVADYERARDFYGDVLGFELIVDDPPHYARFRVPGNGATLSLDLDPDAKNAATEPSAPTTKARVVLYFECEEMDEVCADLEKKGVTFDHKPQDMSWLWREARFRDPDGHALVIYWAGVNRLDPPWRVGRGTSSASS